MSKAPERNKPCPCGSGVKHKKCCGSMQKHNEREAVRKAEDAARREAAMKELANPTRTYHRSSLRRSRLAVAIGLALSAPSK